MTRRRHAPIVLTFSSVLLGLAACGESPASSGKAHESVSPATTGGQSKAQPGAADRAENAQGAKARISVRRDSETPVPPFVFSSQDEAFLDEVQRGCFEFFWRSWTPPAGLAPDRSSKPSIVSVAGTGFQLSALVVGAERGWVTKDNAKARALAILKLLASNPNNRKAGLFYHFIDGESASVAKDGYEHVVSTIDSALLFAGILTASSYFGGEVAVIGDRLVLDADWRFFAPVEPPLPDMWPSFVSLGWRPKSLDKPTGDGDLLSYQWIDSGDEHRLVTFLAVAAPNPAFAIEPDSYYRLRRQLGQYGDSGPMNWFPWSGAMFVSFFAHCWIDYRAIGADDPAAFAFAIRPAVDWWENARRSTRLHQLKAIKNPKKLAGFGELGWGLSASDVKAGYAVPGVFPDPISIPGSLPEIDYPVPGRAVADDFGDGTLAPYAAGSTIMFDPVAAVKTLRHYREIARRDGFAPLWNDPPAANGFEKGGGFGFQDSFNLGTGWIAPDVVAIDAGPLLLSIENARTGLLWRTFHKHAIVQEGMKRLRMELDRTVHERTTLAQPLQTWQAPTGGK